MSAAASVIIMCPAPAKGTISGGFARSAARAAPDLGGVMRSALPMTMVTGQVMPEAGDEIGAGGREMQRDEAAHRVTGDHDGPGVRQLGCLDEVGRPFRDLLDRSGGCAAARSVAGGVNGHGPHAARCEVAGLKMPRRGVHPRSVDHEYDGARGSKTAAPGVGVGWKSSHGQIHDSTLIVDWP